MARTVRDNELGSKAQRAKLPVSPKPHWRLLSEGLHIGYRKGKRAGKWVVRWREPGSSGGYDEATIAEADDMTDADGSRVLTFSQAQVAARAWHQDLVTGGKPAGPYTVGDALNDYLDDFTGKSLYATRKVADVLIRPELGAIELAKLTADDIAQWHKRRAAAPARLRTGAHAMKFNTRAADTPEKVRARRATANRNLTVLKAALNKAYREGKCQRDDAWRRVKPFAKADGAKLRYLSQEEAKRLVNACDPTFRPMVEAALLTGARYGELRVACVSHFDAKAELLQIPESKGGHARVVYLTPEGVEFFKRHTKGKEGTALIFAKPSGAAWGKSEQNRPMAEACENGKITPAATFHDLRRTYGSWLALNGTDMAVIAEALGHKDERITRRHYAHLAPSHVASVIRAKAGRLNLLQPSSNVVSIADAA